jgi:hypothetical protein
MGENVLQDKLENSFIKWQDAKTYEMQVHESLEWIYSCEYLYK